MTAQPQGAAAPIVFNFNTHSIRTIDRKGEVWFIAADVSDILGYTSAPQMTRNLDDDEKGMQIVHTPGGDQEVSLINESGLYAAILKSRKAEAKQFKRWVTHEVLPAIRQTGSYTQPGAAPRWTMEELHELMDKRGMVIVAKEKPLPAPAISPELAARINRRAWALAQGHYDTYRDRMRRDTLIKAGHATPEEWQPLETTQDVLELLEMQAINSENNAASLRQRGRQLAEIVGKNYDKAVEKFRPPQKREKLIK